MPQLQWQKELRPNGTLLFYALKGSKINATLRMSHYGDWVLRCGALGVEKDFSDKPEKSIDELLQDVKAYLREKIKAKISDLQVFLDEFSDSESPQ